jgi:hypothetical protein
MSKAERTAYDNYMDRLALTISQAVPDGTEGADVISACAAIIGFTLADLPPDKRDKVLLTTIGFIDSCCKARVADAWCKGEQR